MKKKKKWWKVVAVIVVIAIVLFMCSRGKGAQSSLYDEETAQVRDIITYNKYSGNVVAKDSKSIVSEASAKVLAVLVDEGDEVKKGDVIATLDKSNLEYTISLREAAMNMSDLSSAYNIRDAKNAYEDYKAGIENGENAQLLSANATVTNAKNALESAKTAYNNAKKNYEDAVAGKEDGSKLATLHEAALRASSAVSTAQSAYDANEERIEELSQGDTATGGNASELAACLAKREGLAAALSAAKNAASSTYNQYVSSNDSLDDSIDQLKIVMDNAKTGVDNAEQAYKTAQESYNATVTSVNQALSNYQNAVEKVNALSNNEASVLELSNLYDQLEDYTITAPIDGVVTNLMLKEGGMATTGMSVAQVTDFDEMEIEIKIDEYDILGLSIGSEVQVSVDALETVFVGKISEISRFATVAGGVSYFTAKVVFDATDNVRSGMSVEVKSVSKEALQVMSVSMDAIRTRKDNTAYVLIRTADGKEEERDVKTGVSDGNYVQILEGISTEDTILVTPSNPFAKMMQ